MDTCSVMLYGHDKYVIILSNKYIKTLGHFYGLLLISYSILYTKYLL